jgi:hypothetical protein
MINSYLDEACKFHEFIKGRNALESVHKLYHNINAELHFDGKMSLFKETIGINHPMIDILKKIKSFDMKFPTVLNHALCGIKNNIGFEKENSNYKS